MSGREDGAGALGGGGIIRAPMKARDVSDGDRGSVAGETQAGSRSWLGTAAGFCGFVVSLTGLRLIYIAFAPLLPQEALHWSYAQAPDLSYFDHPPMAAYSIWLGTHVFGDTVFGVKVMAVVWSLLTNLAMYGIGFRAAAQSQSSLGRDPRRTAFLVVIVYNLTVFAHASAVTMIPDTPLLFFWILTVAVCLEALERDRLGWWALAGAAFGLGLLSKYTAVALLPAIAAILIVEPQYRHQWRRPGPWLALAIGLLVFTPVVYWNATHDWVSFAFQFPARARTVKGLRLDYFVQLVGTQLAQLLPFGFVLISGMVSRVLRDGSGARAARLLFLTGAFIVGGFTCLSFTTLVKPNWLLPGYTGFIVAAVLVFEDRILAWGRWVRAGAYSSVSIILLAHVVWVVPNVPLGEANTWSGWAEVAPRIAARQQQLGGRQRCFVFSNSYKGAALMKFYLPDHQDVYAENIFGLPGVLLDTWPPPDALTGLDALYVISDRREYRPDLDRVSRYFDELSLVASFDTTFDDGTLTRRISCYLGRNYRGLDAGERAQRGVESSPSRGWRDWR